MDLGELSWKVKFGGKKLEIMKTSNSFRVAMAVLAAFSVSAFAPSAPASLTGRTCSERTFGGICKIKWG